MIVWKLSDKFSDIKIVLEFSKWTIQLHTSLQLKLLFKVDDYSHFFLYYFLRDQNSQHFKKDLLAVNASAFSFVLCFKAIDYTGASNYVISAN